MKFIAGSIHDVLTDLQEHLRLLAGREVAQDSFEDPGRVARVLEAARYDLIEAIAQANQPRSPERTDIRRSANS